MQAITGFALRHPRSTLLVAAALSALAAAGIPGLRTEVGYRGILGDDHPSVRRLEAFIDQFGGGLPVVAVWSCDETTRCNTVFDEGALHMARAVGEEISAHPLVRRVESPATAAVLVPSESGFEVRRFVEDGRIAEDRDALARRAVEDASWRGTLVSPDGRVGAIVLQLASSDSRTTSTVVPALRGVLAPFESQGFRFYLAGDPVDFAVAGGELQRETPRIVPVVVLLIGVVVFALFRSWRATALALGTTGLAVLWAVGSMAWLGWPQSELTQALAPAILVIGVCTSIHVLARYATRVRELREQGDLERRRLMSEVAREVGPPCLMASLTTAAGVLSFSTSGFESFLRFGVTAAIGILAAFALTFTVLPIFLVRIRPEGRPATEASRSWDRALRVVLSVAERRGALILVAAGLLLFFSGVGISRLEIDVDERELFGSNNPVVKWAEFVEAHLRPSDTLEIEIGLPEGASALDPEAIDRIAAVQSFLPTVEGLGRVRSFLDPLRRLNQILHEDDPSYYRAATSRAGNAQLLWVLRLDESTRPDPWIDAEHRSVRLSVEAEPLPKSRRIEILETVTAHLGATLPPRWEFQFTGPFALYLDLVREMHRTQLRSFATAALVVTALFWLFLWATGSPPLTALRWAGVGMVPNALPVVATLGAMGLWGIALDVGTIMVGAIVLGIAVDDTIHLVAQYRSERNAGTPVREAMSTAVLRVGRAVITTSIALSVGFFALTISSWQSIASFGLLSGIAILGALLADLFVLPSLVLGLGPVATEPERRGATRTLPPAGRRLLGILAVLGLTATLLAGAASSFPSGASRRLGCLLLPSGHVSVFSAFASACPLETFDRVEVLELDGRRIRPQAGREVRAAMDDGETFVRARVQREGRALWETLPLAPDPLPQRVLRFGVGALVATAMLGLALFLVSWSSAVAAAPFLAFYGFLAVIVFHALCGAGGDLAALPYLAASGMLPAAALHLALSFPRRGGFLSSVPRAAPLLYVAGAVNAAILIWGAFEYPTLFRAGSSLSGSLSTLIWLALLGKCVLARSESESGLERARANVVLLGTVLALGALVLAWLAGAWEGVGSPDLWPPLVLAVLPLPLGYALARYQLNDVRPHFRQAVSYSLFQLFCAASFALLLFSLASRADDRLLSHPAPALCALLLLVVFAATARDWIWRSIRRRIPTVDGRLREIEESLDGRFTSLRDGDRAASFAAEALQAGLTARGVAIFLPAELGWRLAARCGACPPLESDLADTATRIDPVAPVHLDLEVGVEGLWADRLREAGIEIAAPLRSGAERVGIALIAGSRDGLPYSSRELDFVASVCARAAASVHNAALTEELLQAERFATVGQIATGLAHDLGKPINVIYQRARSMSRDSGASEETRRHASGIVSLADEALACLDHLLEYGRPHRPDGRTPIGEVIERAVQAVERLHGRDRVVVRLTPGLPAVSAGRDLRHVVSNLLDNALRAGGPQRVEVYAVLQDGEVVVDVIDHGRGMTPETADRAFEPFFTTRPGREGRGVGLAASRAVVGRIGGSLELASRVGAGTRARLRIPVPDAESRREGRARAP